WRAWSTSKSPTTAWCSGRRDQPRTPARRTSQSASSDGTSDERLLPPGYFDEVQAMHCGPGWCPAVGAGQAEELATDSIARARETSLSVTAFSVQVCSATRTRL